MLLIPKRAVRSRAIRPTPSPNVGWPAGAIFFVSGDEFEEKSDARLFGTTSPSCVRKRKSPLPMRIVSPCSSDRRSTGIPLTKVPLLLSRSTSSYWPLSPSRCWMVQWTRETVGSARHNWFASSLPMESGLLVSSRRAPVSEPEMARRRGFIGGLQWRKV